MHNTIKEPTASEREAVSGITAEWVENGLQTVSFSLMGYWFGDFTLRNKTEARTRVLRYLRTQPYDVLVIGGLEYQMNSIKVSAMRLPARSTRGWVWFTPTRVTWTRR